MNNFKLAHTRVYPCDSSALNWLLSSTCASPNRWDLADPFYSVLDPPLSPAWNTSSLCIHSSFSMCHIMWKYDFLRRIYSESQAHTASAFIYGLCTISSRLIAYCTELAKQSPCSGSSLCSFFLLAKPLSCTEEAVLLLMWAMAPWNCLKPF